MNHVLTGMYIQVCIKTCRATIVYHYFSICIYIYYILLCVSLFLLLSLLPVVQARVRKDKGFVVGQFWSLGSMGSDAGYPGWFVFRVSAMDHVWKDDLTRMIMVNEW